MERTHSSARMGQLPASRAYGICTGLAMYPNAYVDNAERSENPLEDRRNEITTAATGSPRAAEERLSRSRRVNSTPTRPTRAPTMADGRINVTSIR